MPSRRAAEEQGGSGPKKTKVEPDSEMMDIVLNLLAQLEARAAQEGGKTAETFAHELLHKTRSEARATGCVCSPRADPR